MAETVAAERRLPRISTVEHSNAFLREHYVREFQQAYSGATSAARRRVPPSPRRDVERISRCGSAHGSPVTPPRASESSAADRAESWRGTLESCAVLVHRHLTDELSLSHGPGIRRAATPR